VSPDPRQELGAGENTCKEGGGQQWLLQVVVIHVNKLLLQEIKQLSGIELLTSSFLENLALIVPISREGKMPVLTTCGRAWFRRSTNSKLFA